MKSIKISGDAGIDWMYPNIYEGDEPRSKIKISLYHVRAANDIEIEYDSTRDGYVIYMTACTGYKDSADGTYEVPIEYRREKAFIPSWDKDEVE